MMLVCFEQFISIYLTLRPIFRVAEWSKCHLHLTNRYQTQDIVAIMHFEIMKTVSTKIRKISFPFLTEYDLYNW